MTDAESELLTALAAHVATAPDSLAVIDGTRSWTYQEFATAAGERARQLGARGVRAGQRVAVIADNSGHYLINAAAVWAAGAVLVTVYPSSGRSELRHCITSSDPAMVLASPHLIGSIETAAPGYPVASIDVDQPLPEARSAAAPSSGAHDGLALICFTSGSTARPKAVMHTHSGLGAAARTFAKVWHVTAQDRTIVCLPMAWAFGLVTTSMTTLVAGGTVLALPRARPEMLMDALTKGRATFFAGVTSMYAKMVDHFDKIGAVPQHNLRLCVSGGEPRNEAVFDRWLAATGVPVHDNYAASECFPVITYDPHVDPVPRPRSAGKLVPGARMRVLDPAGEEVRPGEVGEAFWRGPAQFVGYWNDEEATKKAITPDGWYRTNDLVRVDPEGYVFVEGRLSDMIIRGGSNVSPGEVETVLRQHPTVEDAAVVGLPDPKLGQRVVAAVVPAARADLDPVALIEHCRAQLAGYKVPSEIVTLDELPISSSTGKVDRKRVVALITDGER